MAERDDEIRAEAERAIASEKALASVVEKLSGASRRGRQFAAAVVSNVAQQDPAKLVEHIPLLVDALNRPEAQTRWECLDALCALVTHDSRACERAVDGADTALFDEDNGPVRLAALRFLCKIGATTPTRSKRVWPMLDEAIQCYHGDLEFNDMLVALVEFSAGKLDDSVKEQMRARMAFDATNSKGSLQRRAAQILENLGA